MNRKLTSAVLLFNFVLSIQNTIFYLGFRQPRVRHLSYCFPGNHDLNLAFV
jgi:hypothetical protein